MPPNMMNALIGSSEKVTGRSTATVSAGPMPGNTPTAVPSVTPTNAQSRCVSVSALANPSRRDWRVSVKVRPTSQPARQDARRQLQLQHAREQQERSYRDTGGVEGIAARVRFVERPRHEPEQDGGRDDE